MGKPQPAADRRLVQRRTKDARVEGDAYPRNRQRVTAQASNSIHDKLGVVGLSFDGVHVKRPLSGYNRTDT